MRFRIPFGDVRQRLDGTPPEPFTGTCSVRQHTADGHYVGRCYHSTYGGVCHLHGDVSRFLVEGADLTDADDRLVGYAPHHDQRGTG